MLEMRLFFDSPQETKHEVEESRTKAAGNYENDLPKYTKKKICFKWARNYDKGATPFSNTQWKINFRLNDDNELAN